MSTPSSNQLQAELARMDCFFALGAAQSVKSVWSRRKRARERETETIHKRSERWKEKKMK